jgi:uncharacterized protein YqgV (UPF0045/DUF77 family)
MIVAFSVSPSGGDEAGGVGEAVAEAIRVVRASGLPNETKQAVEAVVAVSPRVSLVLKADIRPGYTGQLTAKVARVNEALNDTQL